MLHNPTHLVQPVTSKIFGDPNRILWENEQHWERAAQRSRRMQLVVKQTS
jgi:hypothetical protein